MTSTRKFSIFNLFWWYCEKFLESLNNMTGPRIWHMRMTHFSVQRQHLEHPVSICIVFMYVVWVYASRSSEQLKNCSFKGEHAVKTSHLNDESWEKHRFAECSLSQQMQFHIFRLQFRQCTRLSFVSRNCLCHLNIYLINHFLVVVLCRWYRWTSQ